MLCVIGIGACFTLIFSREIVVDIALVRRGKKTYEVWTGLLLVRVAKLSTASPER